MQAGRGVRLLSRTWDRSAERDTREEGCGTGVPRDISVP